MNCNMRMIVEGGHNRACDYCQRVVPLAGQLTVEMREFACTAPRQRAEQEHRHIINQPCTRGDWAICPLNEHRVSTRPETSSVNSGNIPRLEK